MTEILVSTRPNRSAEAPLSAGTPPSVVLRDSSIEILTAGTPVDHDVHDLHEKLCVLCGDIATPHSAEAMLALHESRGPTAVADATGQFVAVFYDRRSGEISAVHDKTGIRHAYYWTHGQDFVLSTDLLWLVRHLKDSGTPRPALSSEGLALYLTFQYVPYPWTVLEGVLQLPPGAELRVGRHGDVVVRGLTKFPGPRVRHPERSSLEEHSKRVGEILTDSIASQLDGAESVGAMLSGGMDTSSNVALMVERVGIRPVTLTAAFEDPRYDEQPFAAVVADHYGLEQRSVRVGARMLDELPDIVAAFDRPNADQAIFAQYFACRLAAESGCTRVVTGEGGDEVLGYPQHHDEEVLGRPLTDDEVPDYRNLPSDPAALARYYLEKTFLAPHETRTRLFQHLGVDAETPYGVLETIYQSYVDRDPFERLLFGQWRTWLRDGVYMKDSTLLKHFGIAPVLPFMSSELMRYIADLPIEQKLEGLDDKRFLRILLSGSLPREIFEKKKQKFFLPWPRWSREDARDFLRDRLLRSDGHLVGVFGDRLLRALVEENERIEANHSRLLWGMLFLELWFEQRIAPIG